MEREHSNFERLFLALTKSPEKPALVIGQRTLTFGELEDLSRRYASGLAGLGLRPGDRVAVFAESCAEILIALTGHHRSGVIHVPVNPRYRAEEAGHVLSDSGASAVLVLQDSPAWHVLDSLPSMPLRRIVLPAGRGVGPNRDRRDVPFDELLGSSPSEHTEWPLPGDEDTALLVYTSGTTGKSKGVAISFRALVSNITGVMDLWRCTPQDRLAMALPLFHVHGLCLGLEGALLQGSTVLLVPHFTPELIVDAFRDHGATVFMGVPTMYVRLLDHLGRVPGASEALAGGRLFTSGSAPLSKDDFELFERLTSHRILERYGMTETLFTLSNPYDGERRAGTVGLPVAGCDVRIVDEHGKPVPVGELGEVVVRGTGSMTGYWGREAETRAAFKDGWFRTGDTARSDADGYVSIAGRTSVDIIKTGGFKVSAREIEDVLKRHPLVKDVAVVGVPDRTFGQKIAAAVVLTDPYASSTPDLVDELCSFATRSLADYKKPRHVEILSELPRNALGKVQKHLLLERLER